MELYKELEGSEGLACLKNWFDSLQGSREKPAQIKQFFSEPLNKKSLLKFFDKPKLDVMTATHLFSVVNEVLFNINSDLKELEGEALFIVQHLIRQHSSKLRQIINLGSTTSCITGLTFLKECAKLGSIAANDVLCNIQWRLLDFSKAVKKANAPQNQKVLLHAVIDLAISFMDTNDVDCLKQFLKLLQPMSCIFSYLSSVDPEVVCGFLKHLQQNVVLNPSIPKGMKLRIFKDAKSHHLLSLYTSPAKLWSQKDRNDVTEAAHTIMMTLCTSTKFGIVDPKQNLDIYQIIQTKLHIMQIPEGVQLVAGILEKCPDIQPKLMTTFKAKLNPDNEQFLAVLKLLMEIIRKGDPWVKDFQVDETAIQKDMSYVPNRYLMQILEKKMSSLKLAGLKLLELLFRKANDSLCILMEHHDLSQTITQKEILVNHFSKYDSHLGIISKDWNITCNFDHPSFSEDLRMNLLESSAQVLDHYSNICDSRSTIELVNVVEKLSALQTLPENCKINLNLITSIDSLLNCLERAQKYVGFMLIKAVHLNMSEKETPLYHLIKVYKMITNGPEDHVRKVKDSVLKLLSSSLALNGVLLSPIEAKFWLEMITGDLENCTTFLVNLLFKAVSNSRCYREKMCQLEIDSGTETGCSFDPWTMSENLGVEDSEDICVLPAVSPFTIVVLAATDCLKNGDKTLCDYFSSVMCDYIYSLSAPEILARYLLLDESVLSERAIEILQSFLGLSSKKSSLEDLNLSDYLSTVFRDNTVPRFSEFRNSLDDILGTTDAMPLARQLVLYIKREHHSSFTKRRQGHLKFFCKTLKHLLKQLKDNPKSKHRKPIVNFLLTVPLLLETFNPFSDHNTHNPINAVVRILLKLARQSSHVALMQPFFDKLLSHFLCLEAIGEVDIVLTFEDFIPSTVYTYQQLEGMTFHASKLCKGNNIHSAALVNLLVNALTKITSSSQYPSIELMNQLFIKWPWYLQLEHFETTSAIERLCIEILSSVADKSLKNGICKDLLHCDNVGVELRLHVLKENEKYGLGVAKQLYRMEEKPALDVEVFVLSSLIEIFPNNLEVHSLIKCYKHDVLQWARKDGQCCEHHQAVLKYLLTNGDISISKASSICKKWYENIIAEDCGIPSHIVSLCELFEHCTSGWQLLFIFVHGVRKVYKKEASDHTSFLRSAPRIIEQLYNKEKGHLSEEFYTNKSFWPGFVKQVLRTSLSDPVNGNYFLNCLTSLCCSILKSDQPSLVSPKSILDKLHSHSLYLPTMLQPKPEFECIKEAIVKLQQALVEIDGALCQTNHIPVLLGAYGASLSACDQSIYKLLRTYESLGCLTAYPPVLWGSAAVSHFALEATVMKSVGVFRAPRINQILQILDPLRVLNTALHFNANLDFEPTLCECDLTMYDQRYLLLVLNHVCCDLDHFLKKDLLASNVVAVAIASLTSLVPKVWTIGGSMLKRIHLILTTSNERNIERYSFWIWLIEVVRNTMGGKKEILPRAIANFMIQASTLFFQPSEPSYRAVISHLFQQPSLRLREVPGLYKFLFQVQNPPVPETVTFVMMLLKTSLKSTSDWIICLRNHVPKYLMGLLKSKMTTLDVKISLMEALISISYINEGAKFLLEDTISVIILRKCLDSIPLEGSSVDCEKAEILKDNMRKLLLSLWKYVILNAGTQVKVIQRKRRRTNSNSGRPGKKQKLENSINNTENHNGVVDEISEQYNEDGYCLTILSYFSSFVPLLKRLSLNEKIVANMVDEILSKSDKAESIVSQIKEIWGEV